MAVSTTDSKHIKQILAAVIGNALEWYDFIVFGFFAVVLAGLFFPSHDESASLMLVFATFGAGFLARPLGGVVLGFISDKVLTNLLVDELIIIKKYIKIYYNKFKTNLLYFTNISNFPR